MSPEAEAAKYIAKALCIIAMISTAPAEGKIAEKAIEVIGRNPKLDGVIFSRMVIAMAITESTAIYALVAFFTI